MGIKGVSAYPSGLDFNYTSPYYSLPSEIVWDAQCDVKSYGNQARVVYSSETKCFYIFYNHYNGIYWNLAYDVVDQAGNWLYINQTIVKSLISDEKVEDFDVATNYWTNKIWLAYCYDSDTGNHQLRSYTTKDKLYVKYYAPNPSTKKLSLLQTKLVDTALVDRGYYDVDITITKNDYACITAGYFKNSVALGVFWSTNSTTQWIEGANIDLDTMYYYSNLQNIYWWSPMCTFYGETGVLIHIQDTTYSGTSVFHEDSGIKIPDISTQFKGYNVSGQIREDRTQFSSSAFPNYNIGSNCLASSYDSDVIMYSYNRASGNIANSTNTIILASWNHTTDAYTHPIKTINLLDHNPNTAPHTRITLAMDEFGATNWGYLKKKENFTVYYIRRMNKTSPLTARFVCGTWSVLQGKWSTGNRFGASTHQDIALTKQNATLSLLIRPKVITIPSYTRNRMNFVGILYWNTTFNPSGSTVPALVPNTPKLTDDDGNDLDINWIFRGEVYRLSAQFNNSYAGYLSIDDGNGEIQFYWNESNNQGWLVQNDVEYKASLVHFDLITSGTLDTPRFTFTLSEGIDDTLQTDFGYYIEGENKTFPSSGDLGINSIKIYNLGGFTMDRVISNDAGFYPDGHPLQVYAEFNDTVPPAGTSYAHTTQVYRKLQHFHTQFTIDVDNNTIPDDIFNTAIITFEVEALFGTSWSSLMYLEMDIVNGDINEGLINAGQSWVVMGTRWYTRNQNGIMSLNKSVFLTAYPNCGNKITRPETGMDFNLDLYFDRTNNSKTIGGIVNPVYYGMVEKGWFMFANWSPVKFNETYSDCLFALRNPSGNIIQLNELDLIRIKTWTIAYSSRDRNRWEINNFKHMNYKLAETRFIGIDKPAITETLVVDMGNYGFLAPLYKAITDLGKVLSDSLTGIWKVVIGAIDTVLEFLGLPKGTFSGIITLINSILEIMGVLLANITAITLNIVNAVTDVILIIFTLAERIIYTGNLIISTTILYYNQIVSMFTGGWTNVSNMWATYDLLTWFQFWLIAIFPLAEYEKIANSDDQIKALKDEVTFFYGLIMGVVKAFSTIFHIVTQIIQVIVELLPF